MATRIKLKTSTVLDKVPTTADLELGEIALNANAGSVAAYVLDTANNIVQIAGSGAGDTPNLQAVLSEGNTATIGMTIADSKITLANDGSADFVGAVDIGNTSTVLNADGSATFGSGTIDLNADGSASFTGQVTVPTTPVAATDAASKDYVDGQSAEGFWSRNGTTLSPINAGDNLAGIGTITATSVSADTVTATDFDLEALTPLP